MSESKIRTSLEAMDKEAAQKLVPLIDKYGIRQVAGAMRLLACTKALEEIVLNSTNPRVIKAASMLWDAVIDATAENVKMTGVNQEAYRAMLVDIYSVVTVVKKEHLDRIKSSIFH